MTTLQTNNLSLFSFGSSPNSEPQVMYESIMDYYYKSDLPHKCMKTRYLRSLSTQGFMSVAVCIFFVGLQANRIGSESCFDPRFRSEQQKRRVIHQRYKILNLQCHHKNKQD